MPSPASTAELLDLITRSGVADDRRVTTYIEQIRTNGQFPAEPVRLAEMLVAEGLLTRFQAEQLLQGKWKRFNIGKYKVLERLGTGGMGSVYLCEHTLMRRRVAVKVLPAAKADDPAALERFHREARVVAALDHPNIVRAYDIDRDDKLHFLVMEHVDGASLQEIIKRSGPMAVVRACHYMRQSAIGLQHAHDSAAIVHRDIKPGNILVDRNGIVKILDMGLARFFHDEDDVLTRKYDENVLGTADYLAPEQALDSHTVDIRADIYSLGATFYFILCGKPPFADGTVAQKLMWHQTRQPQSIRKVRPEVPEGVAAIIDRMMAKDPAARFQLPIELAEALAPWTQTPIAPPPEIEMPQLSRAAMGAGEASMTRQGPATTMPSPAPRRQWQVSTAATGGRTETNTTPQPIQQPAPQPTTPVPTNPAVVQPTPQRRPVNPMPTQPSGQQRPMPVVPQSVQRRPVTPSSVQPTPAAAIAPSAVSTAEAPGWEEVPVAASADARPRRAKAPPPAARVWFWFGLAAGLLAVVIGGSIYFYNSAPSVKPVETVRLPLVVDTNGGDGSTYRTIYGAWGSAKTGDRIIMRSDSSEALTLLNRKGLILESEGNKEVFWKAPAQYKPEQRKILLQLQASENNPLDNVVFRGITFDGSNSTDTLVYLFGRCPGVKFEKCTFKGFLKQAVLIENCEGDQTRPVEFLNCTFKVDVPSSSAIVFDLKNNVGYVPKNRYIAVKDPIFSGPGRKVRTPNEAFIENITLPADWKPVIGQ